MKEENSIVTAQKEVIIYYPGLSPINFTFKFKYIYIASKYSR